MEEQKQKSYITKDMTISEIIELYPETMDVIMQYQLSCVGCGIADFETIESKFFPGLDGKIYMNQISPSYDFGII